MDTGADATKAALAYVSSSTKMAPNDVRRIGDSRERAEYRRRTRHDGVTMAACRLAVTCMKARSPSRGKYEPWKCFSKVSTKVGAGRANV